MHRSYLDKSLLLRNLVEAFVLYSCDINVAQNDNSSAQIFLLLFDAKELPELIEENYKWCISSKDYFLLLLIIVLSY